MLERRPDSAVLAAVEAHRRLPEVIEAREALEVKLAALAPKSYDDDLDVDTALVRVAAQTPFNLILELAG